MVGGNVWWLVPFATSAIQDSPSGMTNDVALFEGTILVWQLPVSWLNGSGFNVVNAKSIGSVGGQIIFRLHVISAGGSGETIDVIDGTCTPGTTTVNLTRVAQYER